MLVNPGLLRLRLGIVSLAQQGGDGQIIFAWSLALVAGMELGLPLLNLLLALELEPLAAFPEGILEQGIQALGEGGAQELGDLPNALPVVGLSLAPG